MRASHGLLLALMLTAASAHAQPAPADPATARDRSIAAMTAGIDAFNQGSVERALTELKRAVDLDATNHLAHYHIGRVHAQQQQWPLAASAFEVATGLHVDPMYLLWTGVARLRSGRANAAIPMLEKAVALQPGLFRAHNTLAQIHLARGATTEGAAALMRACQTAPKAGQACLELGSLYLSWGLVDEAIKVLAQTSMYAVEPAVVAGSNLGLGVAYQRKGDATKAIESFTRAIDVRRDLHEARFRRGLAHARRGDRAAALADLKEFLASGVGDAWQIGLAAETYQSLARP